MKLSELMAGYTPASDFKGVITNDDYVLAVDISETKDAEVGDYVVAEGGVTGLNSTMNAQTRDKTYIRAGQSTTKTGTQRVFSITGDRYIGDDFQDFALSHKIKYGTGEDVVVPYVYFNLRNGKGEKGTGALIVNSDGNGNAGETSGIDIELRKSNRQPEEYTYASL